MISQTHQKQMGAGSVRINGNGNRVHGVNTEFGVRGGFDATPALVAVTGDNNSITGCVVEGVPTGSAHAFYASGNGLTFSNNWAEINGGGPMEAKDKDCVRVREPSERPLRRHRLSTTNHRVKFINSQVTFTLLIVTAENFPLRDFVLLDPYSTLNLEFAISRHGLGDHGPAVGVAEELVLVPGGDLSGGVWSPRAQRLRHAPRRARRRSSTTPTAHAPGIDAGSGKARALPRKASNTRLPT